MSLYDKKIACIGNMNQSFFALSRYLRDKGLKADLFIPEGLQEHFKPESDTFGTVPEWVYRVPWGLAPDSLFRRRREYRDALKPYDLILGHTYAPAVCFLARKPLDIFWPHGVDLYSFPFPPERGFSLRRISTWRRTRIRRTRVARFQRKGIQASRLVLVDDRVPAYRSAVERLGVPYLRLGPPTLHAPEYDPAIIRKHAGQLRFYKEFAQVRERYDVVVFSHSRQLWTKKIGDLDVGKGNPVLIEGFAKFAKAARSNSALVLFDYGPDVERSRKLVADLGIDDRVVWMPLMPRKEIMAGLALADIGADQFISGTFGGAGQEILAMGKPLFVYVDSDWRPGEEMNVPPCVNVHTPDEVCAALIEYERDRETYRRIGESGRNWFSRFRGEGLADFVIALFGGLSDGSQASELQSRLESHLNASGRLGSRASLLRNV